jgi:hypothetical protein
MRSVKARLLPVPGDDDGVSLAGGGGLAAGGQSV